MALAPRNLLWTALWQIALLIKLGADAMSPLRQAFIEEARLFLTAPMAVWWAVDALTPLVDGKSRAVYRSPMWNIRMPFAGLLDKRR